MPRLLRLLAVFAAFAVFAFLSLTANTAPRPQLRLHSETRTGMRADPLYPSDPFWLYGATTYYDDQTDDGNLVEKPSYGVDAIAAWPTSRGAGQIIAVIDSGFDTSIPYLASHLWTNPAPTFGDLHGANVVSMNADISEPAPRNGGHGTTVAALAAEVAPDAQLMLLRVSSNSDPGETDSEAVLRAVRYAIDHDATVINMSFGMQADCATTIGRAIDDAEAHNIVVVVAAGNEDSHLTSGRQHCPTLGGAGTLAVAATNQQGVFSDFFSNWGAGIQVAAPGEEMYVPGAGGDSFLRTGTSISAPLAAGAVALVRADRPQASAAQAVRAITATAYPLPTLAGKVESGGEVDAAAALDWIEHADLTAPTAPAQRSPTPTFRLHRRSIVVFRWTAATDDRAVAGYRIVVDGRQRATVAASVLSFSVRLAAGRHSWSIVACDTAGNQSG